MKFLERFKDLINENNLKVSEIAEQTNLPRSTISSYINRKSMPSAIQLEILANFFNCSIDYLVGREDDFGNSQQDNSSEPLSSDEQRLLRSFRLLGNVERRALLTTAESLSAQAGQSIRKTN